MDDFIKCFQLAFGIRGHLRETTPKQPKRKKVYRFIKGNKKLAYRLDKERRNPHFTTKQEKCAFLQAIFDDEGSARKGDITFTNTEKKTIFLVQKFLKDIGIRHNRVSKRLLPSQKTHYTLFIFRQENLRKYRDNIGFLSQTKMATLINYCATVNPHIYPYPPKVRKDIIKLRKNGKSVFDTAKITNISTSTISNVTKNMGIRNVRYYPKEIERKIVKAVKNGISYTQAAKDTGVNHETARKMCHRKHVKSKHISIYPDSIKRKAIEKRRNIESIIQIAKELGVSKQTVSNWTKHLMIKLRTGPHEYPLSIQKKIKEMRTKRITQQKIAEQLNIGMKTVKKYTHDMGIHNTRYYPKEVKEKVMRMKKKKMLSKEIARKTGVSETTIRRWTKNM